MAQNIDFLSPEKLGGDYLELQDHIRRGVPSAALGVHFSLKCLLACFAEERVLYLTASRAAAAEAAEELRQISGRTTVHFIGKDDLLLFKNAYTKDSVYKRLAALYEIQKGAEIIVADIESVLSLCPPKIDFIRLNKGGEYSISELSKKLTKLGYTKNFAADSKGSFSVRGDIVDVFPINADNPYRLDFFGDELESIKIYDFLTGEKLSDSQSVEVITSTEISIDEGEADEILRLIEKELYEIDGEAAFMRADSIYGEIKGLISAGANSDKLSYIMPLIKNAVPFFSYLSQNTLVVYDESKMIYDKMTGIYKEHNERVASLRAGGEVFSFSKYQLIDKEHFFIETENFKKLSLQNLLTSNNFFNPLKIFKFKSTQVGRYLYNVQTLISDIRAWLKSGYTVAVFTENLSRAEKLFDVLLESGLSGRIQGGSTALERISIIPKKLEKGILLHDCKLAVIGSGDLYAKKQTEKRLRKKRNDLFISPEIGDYAVHEQHGVGRITGTKRIETTEGAKDYIALEYKGGDTLYVPVEQMNILSRYMGEGSPSLGKIGGKEFERAKERAAAAIKKLAIDLKKLYSEREEAKGFCYNADDELMEEFVSAFEFETTLDQAASYEEIRQDMESDKVMDRLLCGDVGYGKTEVALRAAFKAVLSGKQVALLCPTTILSEQHYNTAVKRFENFGVKVEVINRFKSGQRQREITESLKNGDIDIIIGTHRLLSKDIAFNNLGLLILDEEQRFGVEHKEKIKTLKSSVDCLTMTATPIPRTLYMSLAGIRDISTIETPPKERLPIETSVVEESEALIRDACIRELSRGGQTFILYNRVESIYTFSEKVRALVPEGKIAVTHGRMSENELENNILRFYSGESNILITTTIIENGIDLPNANTIIIIDSDRLGISQLYQLRGRVGRSNRLAQAYFTYKGDRVLSEDAAKRLSAIMEFTELGSGFKIAMRDLEIRGAGNVLGGEQHGHIAKIGYELYSKLLKEEISGEIKKDVELDIKTAAYIPEDYIESSSARLDCYKKISEISNEDDFNRMAQSIEDMYGTIPKGVKNLLLIALLKAAAKTLGAERIKIEGSVGELVFGSIKDMQNSGVFAVTGFEDVKLVAIDKPLLKFERDKREVLAYMTEFARRAVTFTK